MENRRSGVLMHITSLPNDYGIGTLGKESFDFVDFLVASGQKLWQILPLGPTGYGNSPYQCFSTFAGNPLMIDLKKLVEKRLLMQVELDTKPSFTANRVDFDIVKKYKEALLRKAFDKFNRLEKPSEYSVFCKDNDWWLDNYAEFMGLRCTYGNDAWYEWKKFGEYSMSDAGIKEAAFHKFVQFEFFSQWNSLKHYANSCGIEIIGDLPIYVASDSADTFGNKTLFLIDGRGRPTHVAGVPPDYFSETGQLWGNTVYRWGAHKSSRFRWWISRIKFALEMYDYVRVDHFRGLCEFWAVPSKEITAENGEWRKAEGRGLFTELRFSMPDMKIIAEDLGVITDDVIRLRDDFGLPGMKILQFAFDGNDQNSFCVYKYPKNCVAYSGTHDNDTLRGWLDKLDEATKKRVVDYVGSDGDLVWNLLRILWSSVADTVVIPMQDLLELGSEARMNTPSTIESNWQWRVEKGYFEETLTSKIRDAVRIFGR